MDKGLKHILIWSFAAFFSFAGSGLNWAAHCYNACEIETMQCVPATDCGEHSDSKQADCHFHRLVVDKTIVSSHNPLPELIVIPRLTRNPLVLCEIASQTRNDVFSSFPQHKIANRDLLTVISCFII